MLQALSWAAGRVHGLSFPPLPQARVVHRNVGVFEVERRSQPVGVLYLDLFQRPGKAHGSHQHRFRAAENFQGRVLPISSIVSGVPAPAPGQPALLPWEYANVLLHEFGQAVPAGAAFRALRGRDPDPGALMRRFGLGC